MDFSILTDCTAFYRCHVNGYNTRQIIIIIINIINSITLLGSYETVQSKNAKIVTEIVK